MTVKDADASDEAFGARISLISARCFAKALWFWVADAILRSSIAAKSSGRELSVFTISTNISTTPNLVW